MIFSGDRIGPTAHYTGYVWARDGLSHPELATAEGRVLFEALQPAMIVSRAAGSATLEAYLLARHRAIDARLERAIERGEVTQVIEVACGLSPRGWRFAKRYGDLLDGYVMDIGDGEEVANVAPRVTLAPTLMTNLAEREELGRVVLEAASALASMKRGRVVA